MSISKLLKDQEAWIRQAEKSLAQRPVGDTTLKLPEEAKEARLATLKQRVERLQKEREAVVARYDSLIATEKAEIERVEKEEVLGSRPGTPGGGTPRPRQTAPKSKAKPTAPRSKAKPKARSRSQSRTTRKKK